MIAAPIPRLDLWPERPYLRKLLYSNHALRGRWPYRAIVTDSVLSANTSDLAATQEGTTTA